MPQRILVTGGAGFIGSVITKQLVDRGDEVLVFDNLSNGREGAVPQGATLVNGDLSDRGEIDRIFENRPVDAVIHLAASIEAGESMKFPEKYFRNNTTNTLTLLEAVIDHKVPRFVFSSTAALYGTPDRTPIEEGDPLHPTNTYGESKLLVERMLAWFHGIHGLRYACLRYFNAAGATKEQGEDHRPESHLIPLILQVASGKREYISIFGTDYPTPDGTCVRDYVHVQDLARAHVAALSFEAGEPFEAFNLGTGQGRSVREVVRAVERVTGRPVKVTSGPRRPGDPPALVAQPDRARAALGFTAQWQDLEAIVETTARWRRDHPHGYGQTR